eukprot:272001-Chlamydomonas_euryale.AAC.1
MRGEGGSDAHDSFEDAAVTMRILQHELSSGCSVRQLPPPATRVPKEELKKLLVHGIPRGTGEEQLRSLFVPATRVAAAGDKSGRRDDCGDDRNASSSSSSSSSGSSSSSSDTSSSDSSSSDSSDSSDSNGDSNGGAPANGAAAVAATGRKRKRGNCAAGAAGVPPDAIDIEGDVGSRKVYLVFKNPAVADAAFASLTGERSVDSVGRASKRVALPGGKGWVTVRKMACHNGLMFGRDKGGKAAAH